MIKQKELITFLKRNPQPKDKTVHMWAVNHGYKVDTVEEAIYKIASKHVRGK